MCKNKLLWTTVVAVLLSLSSVSQAARFVNLDYRVHDATTDNGDLAPGDPLTADGSNTTCGATFANVGAYDIADTNGDGDTEESEVGMGSGGGASIETLPIIFSAAALSTGGNALGCVPDMGVSGTVLFDGMPGQAAAPSDVDSGVIDSDETLGRAFAVETLGGMGVLPSGENADGDPTPKYAGVMYVIDGTISNNFTITFTLSEGTFADEPFIGIYNGITPGVYTVANVTRTSTGKGNAKVTFTIKAATNPLGEDAGDYARIFLLYNVEDAVSLQTAGGKVTMKADVVVSTGVGTSASFETQEVTIFTSKSTLDASITAEEAGNVYVSVDSDQTLFTDNEDDTLPDASDDVGGFRDINRARIGYLKMSREPVFEPDGITPFKLGAGLGLAGTSEFVIDLGQFAASKSGLGKVELVNVTDGTTLASAFSADGSLVVFPLDDTLLGKLQDAVDGVAIEIVVDTTNMINLVEERPKATLNINFDEDTDVKMDEALAGSLQGQKLRSISLNGKVCWAFNIPPATGIQDVFNLRITNLAAKHGALTVTLFEVDGTEVGTVELVDMQNAAGVNIFPILKSEKELGTGTSDVKNQLPKGSTLYINAEALRTALGEKDWTSRGVLRVRTQLSDIEMLALLRNQLAGEESNPLINMSLGAQGGSCSIGQ